VRRAVPIGCLEADSLSVPMVHAENRRPNLRTMCGDCLAGAPTSCYYYVDS
jgi:hypothetical protein